MSSADSWAQVIAVPASCPRWAAPACADLVKRALLQLLAQLGRRGHEVGSEHQVLDRRPVNPCRVQPEPNPTFWSDVRRKKVSAWIHLHQSALLAWRRLAHQRDASVTMMVVEVVREDLLPYLERQVLGTGSLGFCLRQRSAQRNQLLPPAGDVR